MEIEIEESLALDDSCEVKYWARGHIDIDDFLEAVEEYHIKNRNPCGLFVHDAEVKHEYWRSIPLKGNIVGDFQFVKSKKGYGAFKVTVLDEWYPM